MRRPSLSACFLLAVASASGSDLKVTVLDGATYSSGEARVQCRVEWKNGWHNAKNHDAAWIVAKYKAPGMSLWRHASLRAQGRHTAATSRPHGARLVTPSEGTGVFVQPERNHRGDFAATLDLELDAARFGQLQAGAVVQLDIKAVEMVYVPEGPFYLGETHPDGHEFAALYRVGADGKTREHHRVTSEAAIEVADAPGKLFYTYPKERFQVTESGDQKGPIPSAFPKGFSAFYCMKYEISQGQYADFLNALSVDGIAFRNGTIHPEYQRWRGGIRPSSNGRLVAARPNEPMNYLSWEDGSAWLAWMGLRPMTELEFTKACRGPDKPVARDYPWNTASKAGLERKFGEDGLLQGRDESKLTEANRHIFGASYYWIMDLASGYWERVITFGSPAGRAFTGEHGSGDLYYGFQFVPGWPNGDIRSSGFGYRGGGYYTPENAEGDHVNSPVEFRRYGSWGDGPRTMAYGFRGVRSAPALGRG